MAVHSGAVAVVDGEDEFEFVVESKAQWGKYPFLETPVRDPSNLKPLVHNSY
jgi:hypothetical protein